MIARLLSLFLSILTIVSQAQAGPAPHADWTKVQKLKPNTRVIIKLRSGEWLRANLVKAYDTQLRLEQEVSPDNQGLLTPREVQRSDVQLLYRVSPPLSQFTRKIIGGAIGLGIALAAGAIADSQAKSHEDDGLLGVSLSLITVPVGVAIGGHITGQEKHRLIYESP